jgi:hypothetical protein
VRLWDAGSGQELRILKGHTDQVYCVAFSPDGTRLASAGDGTVKLWDVASGQELRTLKRHSKEVYNVAFSPDGTRLASAGWDGSLKLWDGASGQELHTLKGHSREVSSVAFSPDGARLASAGADGSVKLWDTASGQELRTLKRHTGQVYSVAFGPDGKWLASAGNDGTVRLWDARSPTPDIKAEVEAVELLETLFSKPLPKTEVRAAIQRDKIISEAARQKALELVERFKGETNSKKYHAAAWPVLRHPYANVFMCQFALAQMNAAYQRAPDNASYRIALGVAQYRLGKFQKERYPEALATLTRCDQNHPTTLAFLALTQHQLGQKEQARSTLAGLRELMKDKRWAENTEALGFLREAEALIEGKTG